MKKLLWILIWIAAFVTLNNNIALADNDWVWFWSFIWVSWIHVIHTDNPTESDEALHIIIRVIDRILSLVSVIAIVIFLVWWFKVLTSNWDDTKAKAWYKIIKNATIWLVIIWLTRWAVNLIFWFVNWAAWEWDLWWI